MNNSNNRQRPKSDRESVTKRPKKKEPSTAVKVIGGIFKVNIKIVSYIINIVFTVLLIGIITGGIVAGAFAIYIKNYIDPTMEDLQVMTSSLDRTTSFHYRVYDDRFEKTNPRWVEWEEQRLYGTENRFWASYKNMPINLTYAFISIEDHRFFEHNGVDYWRSGGAVLNFFVPSGKTFGGSTLTQQLIKLLTGEDDYRIQRKIQEVLRALNLEKNYTKEEILENYLNIIPLSNGCYGVQSAAHEFFDKDVSELTLIECAALASIVQNPTKYNPIRNPENNKTRRNTVLMQMKEYGHITQEEFDEAYNKDLVITRPKGKTNDNIKSWYIEQVMTEVVADLVKNFSYTEQMAWNMMYSGGLNIYISMDKTVQDVMDYVYTHDEYFLQFGTGDFQSAMTIIDPQNGDLLGIVGGRGEKQENRGLNRASGSFRSPGSSIKPVSIYGPAMELGLIDYGSPVDDSPSMVINGKAWPTNLPVRWQGLVPTWHAIEISINTTAVRLLQQMTPKYIFEHMRDELYFTSLIEKKVLPNGKVVSDVDISPLALGGMTRGLSVYELSGAYTMFANEGIYSKPRAYLEVKDYEKNTILDNSGVQNQHILMSRENAAIMTQMLLKVVETGTGKLLGMKNDIQVAAKTGTTNDDKDRWFIGYTPYYICGAWFGFDMPKYLGKFSMNPPMVLFDQVMETLHRDIKNSPNKKVFEVPPTVITAQYCRDSGMAPGDYCSLDPRGNRIQTGYYAKGAEPREKCTGHVAVKWCTETRSVAGAGCAAEQVTTIALVREEKRAFTREVWGIEDAQYTYRDVGEAYIYPSSTAVPFYANIIPAGTYVGRTHSGRAVNSFCVEHNYKMTLPVNQRIEETTEAPTEETTEPITEDTDGDEVKDIKDNKETKAPENKDTEPIQPLNVEPTVGEEYADPPVNDITEAPFVLPESEQIDEHYPVEENIEPTIAAE